MIKVYDFSIDAEREATQNDFDLMQIALNKLGNKDNLIKFISGLHSRINEELIKELCNLLKPYMHPELDFTGYSSFSKTWIKDNPDKIKAIDEWRKVNPSKVAN